MNFWCNRHGDFSDDRVISIGSDDEPDQCGQCIAEAEDATWD
jgi:hypothetical protein